MKKSPIAIGIVAALTLACCTSVEELDGAPLTDSFIVPSNYQQVFRNLNRGARNCMESAQMRVDGNLFSELGFGEVTIAAHGLVSSSPFYNAKVARKGNGARVEVKVLTARPNDGARWIRHWAEGGLDCPVIGTWETPGA